jgi:hypothetical protein
MDKPTVFLSHSSKDSEQLVRLKEKLDKKTSGTIDFFLSSDGESIPFGRNWVATLQDALEKTKVCFVFLTPNSALSSWIYFESGYIYSKKIRVIPVALPGVDLAKIPPPLGLLQGFNVHSHESLNNLLRILNDEFETSFSDFFSAAEFNDLFAQVGPAANSYFNQWADYIDQVSITATISETSFLIMEELLQARSMEYGINTNENPSYGVYKSINTYGLIITERSAKQNELEIFLRLSPDVPSTTLELIDELLAKAKANNPFLLSIKFATNMMLLAPEFKLSSRLHKSSIVITKNQHFSYEKIEFTLQTETSGGGTGRYKISASGPSVDTLITGSLKDSKLNDLVALLIQREVVRPNLSPSFSLADFE